MKSNWRVYTKKADFKAIGERFGIDQVMARIIRNRGLETDEQINMYLNGTVDDMHSPHLLKDADKCVDILTDKIQAGKKIHIIGDYDIDGICSTTILYKGLKAAGADVTFAVPDRIIDGYGINEHLIDEAYNNGTDTIITCDNGIAAIEQIKYAKEKGMKVIVTDHHDIPFDFVDGEKIHKVPQADAIAISSAYSSRSIGLSPSLSYRILITLKATPAPHSLSNGYGQSSCLGLTIASACGTLCIFSPSTKSNGIS